MQKEKRAATRTTRAICVLAALGAALSGCNGGTDPRDGGRFFDGGRGDGGRGVARNEIDFIREMTRTGRR